MQDLQTFAAAQAERTREREGIGLCLSGGGFRASLFHLGALRRLHELGVLQKVRTISSVSGGSILAAFLADRLVGLNQTSGIAIRDWAREISAPFRNFCSRDLRTIPFLLHVPWNWIWPQPRLWHLEWCYRRRLTQLTLGELPTTPEFVFCATDLAFGVNWEFTCERAGDYRAGHLSTAKQWPLARAVTASSSFPPIFGPMRIHTSPRTYEGGDYHGPDREKILSKLSLSDGGVYDNMGLEPVWKNRAYVLVSDCGAPFDLKVGETPWSRLLRYTSVLTSQTRALRLRALFAEWNEEPCRQYRGAYWGLTSGIKKNDDAREEVGYSKELAREIIANIRTDLDAFSDAEMSVLENHGYSAADRAIRQRVPELITIQAPLQAPYPGWLDEGKVREALKDSHKRLSLKRLARGLLRTFAQS